MVTMPIAKIAGFHSINSGIPGNFGNFGNLLPSSSSPTAGRHHPAASPAGGWGLSETRPGSSSATRPSSGAGTAAAAWSADAGARLAGSAGRLSAGRVAAGPVDHVERERPHVVASLALI